MPVADYTIERGLGVRERMTLLAKVHAPATLTLLDMLGVASGTRCVDLGCGGADVTIESPGAQVSLVTQQVSISTKRSFHPHEPRPPRTGSTT